MEQSYGWFEQMTRREIHILDEIWSIKIKELAEYTCEHCRIRGMRMEAAHVVGRRHRATRWGCELGDNGYDLCGHCLCHNCHQQFDEHGPLEESIINKTIGVMRKSLIQQVANSLVAKSQDFDEIKALLEAE